MALRAVVRDPRQAGPGLEVQSERAAKAGGEDSAVRIGIVCRSGAIRVDPQHLPVQAPRFSDLRPLARVANGHVQLAVRPEADPPAVVVAVEVLRPGNPDRKIVEDDRLFDASTVVLGEAHDPVAPRRVHPLAGLRVQDVKPAVARESRIERQAERALFQPLRRRQHDDRVRPQLAVFDQANLPIQLVDEELASVRRELEGDRQHQAADEDVLLQAGRWRQWGRRRYPAWHSGIDAQTSAWVGLLAVMPLVGAVVGRGPGSRTGRQVGVLPGLRRWLRGGGRGRGWRRRGRGDGGRARRSAGDQADYKQQRGDLGGVTHERDLLRRRGSGHRSIRKSVRGRASRIQRKCAAAEKPAPLRSGAARASQEPSDERAGSGRATASPGASRPWPGSASRRMNPTSVSTGSPSLNRIKVGMPRILNSLIMPRVLVDVDLGDLQLAFLLVGDLLQVRSDHLAGLAPVGPEIDQNRGLGLEDLGLERAVGDGDGMCHGVFPLWRRNGPPSCSPRALECSPRTLLYNARPLLVFPHGSCHCETSSVAGSG